MPATDRGDIGVTANVRDWWAYAFLVIAAGVLLGYRLTRYFKQGRGAEEQRESFLRKQTFEGDLTDVHHSLDGRSFTDPVTNYMLISGIDQDTDLITMLRQKKYPLKLLPALYHELVHHWCFRSPVGMALAYLQLRARRHALTMDRSDVGGEDSWAVAENVARYEAAVNLMRPLAEGMALFAEFDARLGDSRAASLPAHALVIIFGSTLAEWKGGIPDYKAFARLLDLYREPSTPDSDALRDRKANLLVQPLSTKKGGYLPGYILVKRLRYILLGSTGSDKLWDSDLYLAYLHHFFYWDLGLVATLLDPDTRSTSSDRRTNSVARIIDYLSERFNKFLSTTEAEIAALENEMVSKPRGYRSWEDVAQSAQTGTDKSLATLGVERLKDIEADLNLEAESGSLERMVRVMEDRVLAQRELLCIGSFSGPVRVNQDQRVIFGQLPANPRLPVGISPVGSTLKGVTPGEGEGLLEFYVSARAWYTVMVITRNGEPVLVDYLGEDVDETIKQQFAEYRQSFAIAWKNREGWHDLLEEVLDHPDIARMLSEVRDGIALSADWIINVKVLAYLISDAQQEYSVAAMLDTGFYEVLGRNYDMIRAFARIGLANSAEIVDKQEIARSMADDGLDAEEVFGFFRRCEEAHGVNLIWEDKDWIVCLI